MISFDPSSSNFDIHKVSHEEIAAKCALARLFVNRLSKHPELMPERYKLPSVLQRYVLSQPLIYTDAESAFYIEYLAKSEVYFQLKESLAQQDVFIFDKYFEQTWVSDSERLSRVKICIYFLKEHPQLLPQDITVAMLENDALIQQQVDTLYPFWEHVYPLLLKGNSVASPKPHVPWRKYLSWLLSPFKEQYSQDSLK